MWPRCHIHQRVHARQRESQIGADLLLHARVPMQVWRWRAGAQLEHVRNLTGHSGRIEALSLDAATGTRAASSGRDSTLKVGRKRKMMITGI